MSRKLTDSLSESSLLMPKRFWVIAIFSIAFAYVEAAVVVYLRTIFHPDGFNFPMTVFGSGQLWESHLLTEVGREAATLVLILSSSWLFAANLQERLVCFLAIFALWDIFYYIWLKILINWPASVMDWDILFLIPVTWASPVLAPILVSAAMLLMAIIILFSSLRSVKITAKKTDLAGFILAAFIVIAAFCIAGIHITKPNFQSYFYWSLFTTGLGLAVILFIKCIIKSYSGTNRASKGRQAL